MISLTGVILLILSFILSSFYYVNGGINPVVIPVTFDECTVDTLVLVQGIFRHGNRTLDISEGYANDPHKKEAIWMPLGYGQLTSIGRNTEYTLGKFLRKRYDGYLPRVYFYKDIYVYSSNIYRTKESAQLVCAGLYSPPVGSNKWGEGNILGNFWQPIPVETFSKDIWIASQVGCSPYDVEYDKVMKIALAEINYNYRFIYDYLSEYTGENVTTVKQVAKIYNTLKVEQENNMKLPNWATPELISKISAFRAVGFQERTYNDFMKQIKGGPLLELISINVNNKTRNCLNPDNKMILYSGHDTTIINLLHTLGTVRDYIDPEYGACIMIELHFIKGQYYIKVLYLESGLATEPEVLTLKDWPYEGPIPLNEFNQIINKYKIKEEDWYKQCNLHYCR